MMAYFQPGMLWHDVDGVPINAHGGGLLFHEGRYYWFGEHKIAGEGGNVAHVGVRCYSSDDLFAWKNEGGEPSRFLTIPPAQSSAGCIVERPKVLFCSRHRQVCDVVSCRT